jgi:hypothetical protein
LFAPTQPTVARDVLATGIRESEPADLEIGIDVTPRDDPAVQQVAARDWDASICDVDMVHRVREIDIVSNEILGERARRHRQ